jgi:hypothetical protein
LGQFSKNYRTFYPNGIWDTEKTYSGSGIRFKGSKRHRIPDPDPQHCPQHCNPTPFINLHNIPEINQANSLQKSKPQFFILSIKNKEYEQKEKFSKAAKTPY